MFVHFTPGNFRKVLNFDVFDESFVAHINLKNKSISVNWGLMLSVKHFLAVNKINHR
jgi:hypothetical protein